MTEEEEELSLPELLESLKSRVEQRRENGDYPPGLEEHLAAHFERIVNHRGNYEPRDLSVEIARWLENNKFDVGQVSVRSRIPLGGIIHRMARKIGSRQTTEAFRQMTTSVGQLAQEIATEISATDSFVRAELLNHIDMLYEQIGELYLASNATDSVIRQLQDRIDEMEKRWANGPSADNEN